ncbi:MAG TPA: carboxypeptidase-like regulatory domain-containing protein [Candidatus Limnocylindrales bacterium]|nr:carboxypeptidase-like regulatory domain-containing protein [Candidatus Limnocylindrales bacterium]
MRAIQGFLAVVMACEMAFPAGALAQERNVIPVPSPGNVTLPVDEYNHLLELASHPVKGPEAAPLPYTIQSARLQFHAGESAAKGTVELQGEVLHDGLTKVALASGMTILDAHQNSKSLPFEEENGTDVGVLGGPGQFAVTLDAGLQVSAEAGRASMMVPAPAAGSVELTLTVPGDRTSVRISPGLITSRTSENGQTTVEATLVPGATANVAWTTREVATPTAPKEVRFLSDVKTLVSVGEADLGIAALADVTVVQGEPSQFNVEIPAGYEITGVTGASLDSTETKAGVLTLKLSRPAQRSYQFLISMTRSIGETKADVPFVTFEGTQRETGEILVEGTGTIEMSETEGGGLKRMDFKEASPYLRALARFPLQAAFRYHRQPAETPKLALAWTRFQDSGVLAAVAERATVTTLVTSEGRSLTEVELRVKNQAQPFLKVELPAGASILSAEVAGEKVKPVVGPDGNRVPLLRAGFRPTDAYTVSFVFLHSGTPFAKKGGSELTLPKMDVPIDMLEWEVFLPARYKVKDFGGDAMAAYLVPEASEEVAEGEGDASDEGRAAAAAGVAGLEPQRLLPGQLGGYVVDPSGAVVPGTIVNVKQLTTGQVTTARADQMGRWLVSNVASGPVQVTAIQPGFNPIMQRLQYDANSPAADNFAMKVGSVSQSVTVTSTAMATDEAVESRRIERDFKRNAEMAQTQPSANVFKLQQRAAGVLPIRVDVPHAGNSYHFVRPLVLDEETNVTFAYKTK